MWRKGWSCRHKITLKYKSTNRKEFNTIVQKEVNCIRKDRKNKMTCFKIDKKRFFESGDSESDINPKIFGIYFLKLVDARKYRSNDLEWHKCTIRVVWKVPKLSYDVNNVAEYNWIYDILNPNKHNQNNTSHFYPLLHIWMSTHRSKSRFK